MTSLYTADLHLTSREIDEYRWELFPWLLKRIEHFEVDYLFILGDLTDATDNHDARLVNRIHRELKTLAQAVRRKVIIIKGNHDYVEERNPYFGYIHRSMRGRILYFAKPRELGLGTQRFLLLPHTRSFRNYQHYYDFAKYDRVLIHQPILSATNEQGIGLTEGIKLSVFKGCAQVIAGDVHVPQQMKNFLYCGAPYPIRFGDSFQPRVLLEQDGKIKSISRSTIKKAVVSITDSREFLSARDWAPGDMAKVEVILPRAEFHRWEVLRRRVERMAQNRRVRLFGIKLIEQAQRKRLREQTDEQQVVIKPSEVLTEYGRQYRIDPRLMEMGMKMVKGT